VRTAPILTPLASYLTSKRVSELAHAQIGGKPGFPFINLKAFRATFVHLKFPFFMHLVKRAIMKLKSLMN